MTEVEEIEVRKRTGNAIGRTGPKGYSETCPYERVKGTRLENDRYCPKIEECCGPPLSARPPSGALGFTSRIYFGEPHEVAHYIEACRMSSMRILN